MQSIQVEGVRQHFMAIDSALKSSLYESAAIDFIGRTNSIAEKYAAENKGSPMRGRRVAERQVRSILNQKAKADLETARRMVELQQLSTAQRAVVQRRIETIQKDRHSNKNGCNGTPIGASSWIATGPIPTPNGDSPTPKSKLAWMHLPKPTLKTSQP